MITTSSGLAPAVTAAHRDAAKEVFAHLSRGESLAMIPSLILELSGRICRRAALLEAPSIDPVQSSEDLAALAWIQRALEDVEATIIGLSEANGRRSARSTGRPLLPPGQPTASI
ncbi:hypothetical protein [Arthrobacter sp. Cr_A7]|uniref:hypothetical protein n=1 Tax=Arthrobacter sp. Cr_A7 TaxID=3031017 RepID=UPI0023DB4AD1|nr:hypothetical protein [Arthrobacter sp. Cr_A7]MDF2052131.1 hypothetical protein [Arthrobacter sp. Cr_A7]